MDNRPIPYAEFTATAFWNDPHISSGLLACHLDPHGAMASRPIEFIDRSVAWIVGAFNVQRGSRVLDIGCGPGLYAERLARAGARVLGVDVSTYSIEHARATAARESLTATFVEGDYFEAELGNDHDLALLIYEDYCALSPEQRVGLLTRVREALRPGGALLFDVTAAPRFSAFTEQTLTEPDLMDGFWAPTPYVGTQETFTYPEQRLVLERYTVTRGNSSRVFWNWTQCLVPGEVAEELASAGLTLESLSGDVAGAEYDPQSPTFAVVARREVGADAALLPRVEVGDDCEHPPVVVTVGRQV